MSPRGGRRGGVYCEAVRRLRRRFEERERWSERTLRETRLLPIPIAVMATIAVADIFAPADIHLGPLLVVAPTFTATFAGTMLTAVVGALALTTLISVGLARGVLGTVNLIVQIGSMAVIVVLLVLFCVLRERRERELLEVREVSDAAQRTLLPELPRRCGPLRIASRYHAAVEQAAVGGDLFGAARTATGTRLLIADVRGSGTGAFPETAMVMGAFRTAAHLQVPLPELMAYLEGSVQWGLTEHSGRAGPEASGGYDPVVEETIGREGFVTALVLEIPDDEPVVHAVCCGHPPPYRLRDGRAEALHVDQPAPPLGLGALTGSSFSPTAFDFVEGDTLLLYTDGLSEARNGAGVFFPVDAYAARRAEGGPEALLTGLWADLMEYHGGPPEDDLALIAARREGAGRD